MGFRIDENCIVDTSSVGKSRFPQYDGWGEIVSLYLLPACMGKGYGKALLNAAALELKTMGFRDIFLWVLEENARARRFYERNGFLCTDAFLENRIGGKVLKERAYTRQI